MVDTKSDLDILTQAAIFASDRALGRADSPYVFELTVDGEQELKEG